MKSLKIFMKSASVALIFAFLTGCAAPQIKQRYFWPPLPDTPRIEWLGVYGNANDLQPPGLMAQIIGSDVPVGLEKPLFVAADGFGKVYISDQKLPGIIVFDMGKKEVRVLGGEQAAAFFQRPTGVAVDGEGNVYAGDTDSKKVMVFDRNEAVKAVLDLSKHIQSIGSITVDQTRKRLIIPDVKSHKLAVFTLSGAFIKAIGQRGEGNGEFNYPSSAAVDKDGNIIVCDAMNARIQIFSPELEFITKFGKRGDNPGEFNIIKGAASDSEGHIYVTDGKSHRINILNREGEALMSVGGVYSVQPGASVAPGGFLLPMGIYIDQHDTIYVVDSMNARFQVFQYVTEKYLKEHPVTDPNTPTLPGLSTAR